MKIIDNEFMIENLFIDDFVAYVLHIQTQKKDTKNFESVHKFKKIQINVVKQKKIEKK